MPGSFTAGRLTPTWSPVGRRSPSATSNSSWSANDGLDWTNGASGSISNDVITNNLRFGLALVSNSTPGVSGDQFTHNRSYAISMEGSSPADFAGNTAYGNGYNGIGVNGTLVTSTWTANLAYIVTQNLTIDTSGTLTLQPGAVVKFLANANLIIRGALVAKGTDALPIVFTSIKDDQYGGDTQQDGAATKPAAGDWGTLYFADTSNDAATVLDHTIVRYGGASYNYGSGTGTADITLDSAGPTLSNSRFEFSLGYSLQLDNASSPTVSGDRISDNLSHGAILSASSSPTFSNNVFLRNGGYAVYQAASAQATFDGNIAAGNQVNGIGVTGSLNVNNTWGANLPYIIIGTLTLEINTHLTLEPDAMVKFGAGGKMVVNGQLTASGSAGHPVFFTSLKDDSLGGDTNGDGAASSPAAGDWESITFSGTSGASALDQAVVRFGGSNPSTGMLDFESGAPGTLSHLTVMGSQSRGLYCQNASPLVDQSTFSANAYGVYNDSTGYLVIQNSDIFGNPTFGVYNANPTYALMAANNWWGSPSGPTSPANLGGSGDKASSNVNFAPYAASPLLDLPASLPAPLPAPNPTKVSGVISANTTWALASSPYLVTGDVTVNPGVTLTIEAGVVVKFYPGTNLTVNGILSAVGTSDQRIYFTSLKDDSVGGDSNLDGSATWPAPGDWGRILFGNSSVDALTKLTHAVVRFGGSSGAVQADFGLAHPFG